MEIVMDIETLEIFDVIDSDNQMAVSEIEEHTEEMISKDAQTKFSKECHYLDKVRSIVQLILFDDSPFLMVFEDSS